MSDAYGDRPAFPTDSEHQHETKPHIWHYAGMTLRDYFAGQVIISLCGRSLRDFTGRHAMKEAARMAYECADHMLEARNLPHSMPKKKRTRSKT
jgi:hypothetical protein